MAKAKGLSAQGTELFFIDPATNELVKVGCPTGIEGLSSPLEQVETTCLDDGVRTYRAGLSTPGAASFDLNLDLSDPSHLLLNELFLSRAMLSWVIGFSDGTALPTVDATSHEFVLPAARSWVQFDGYIADYTFSFALNENVKSSVSVQVSGPRTVVPKVA